MAQPDPTPISKDDWCIGVDGGPVDCVATCSERDARLIAAAPELLERLKDAEWLLQGTVNAGRNTIADDEVLANIRATIAKATGNTH